MSVGACDFRAQKVYSLGNMYRVRVVTNLLELKSCPTGATQKLDKRSIVPILPSFLIISDQLTIILDENNLQLQSGVYSCYPILSYFCLQTLQLLVYASSSRPFVRQGLTGSPPFTVSFPRKFHPRSHLLRIAQHAVSRLLELQRL